MWQLMCTGREGVEALLALGASRSEAVKEGMQQAASMALTPRLTQMSVMAIVTIPGTLRCAGGQQKSKFFLSIICLVD